VKGSRCSNDDATEQESFVSAKTDLFRKFVTYSVSLNDHILFFSPLGKLVNVRCCFFHYMFELKIG